MAFDEGLAQLLRDDLAHRPFAEKRMFGGLCFMLDGNMLCGVTGEAKGGGGMFRVGPERMAEALAVPGARPMDFTGRPMKGFVECAPETLADDAARARLLDIALDFAATLPPK